MDDSTPTRPSLLIRLRDPADDRAWVEFTEIYGPVVVRLARRRGLQEADAADLAQEVLLLVAKLPEFRHDPHQSFRAWLRAVTLNKWRERRRRAALPVIADERALAGAAAADDLTAFWEAEYRQHLTGAALGLMQAEFRPATWKACWEHLARGRPAAEVGAELGLSPGAVRAATFRVLARLRQRLAGLLD